MSGKHSDRGDHRYKDEALIRVSLYWDNEQQFERPRRPRAMRRRVLWATDRPVPLGVTS